MKNKRRIVICSLAILLLIAIGACMMWIGRGHTLYIDNKNLDANGTTFEQFHKVEVTVNGEKVAKLSKKERGMTTFMGQKISFSLDIIEKKEDKDKDPVHYEITLTVPYGMDGIVMNLPAYLAGEPAEVWMSEFVPMVQESTEDEEDIPTDEFDVGGDI